jgi:hypothetical protein
VHCIEDCADLMKVCFVRRGGEPKVFKLIKEPSLLVSVIKTQLHVDVHEVLSQAATEWGFGSSSA